MVAVGSYGRSRHIVGDKVGQRNEGGARSAEGWRGRGRSLPSDISLFVFFENRHQDTQKSQQNPHSR